MGVGRPLMNVPLCVGHGGVDGGHPPDAGMQMSVSSSKNKKIDRELPH